MNRRKFMRMLSLPALAATGYLPETRRKQLRADIARPCNPVRLERINMNLSEKTGKWAG